MFARLTFAALAALSLAILAASSFGPKARLPEEVTGPGA